MNVNISICPTSLEVGGDQYDEAALLAAIRSYIEERHPGARITCLQIGHRQGDAWARIDGDDDAGEELMAEFFHQHGADEALFVATDANPTRKQIAALQDEAAAAGDDAMVTICAAALDGDPVALAAAAQCISEAAAQRDE